MPEAPNEKLYDRDTIEPPEKVADNPFAYVELDVTTNFSFLRGASHPLELVFQAADLGYKAMAVTDVNSVAGVVRAYEAARKIGKFHLIVGCRLVFTDHTPDILVWPSDRQAYARLSRLLTKGRASAPKGECHLTLNDFLDYSDGLWAAIALSQESPSPHTLNLLRDVLEERFSLAISLVHSGNNQGHLQWARNLSDESNIPLLATNNVHYHDPGRRPLQDVLTCIRHGCTIHNAGYRLFPNAERYLKSPEQMHHLFAQCPQAIERGLEIIAHCKFELSDLKYEYPVEPVPVGISTSDHLRKLTYDGAAEKYPTGIPAKVRKDLKKELKFICNSKYESYFLTVYDLVRYARQCNILCQGRGSAANSAVCYCLGVTSVDPAKFNLVFERFASPNRERHEPPDIDIDFEHERREEVIQYVYKKYSRDRAAMTASLITYRGRSAVRDVGKALGFGQDALDALAGKLDWWHQGTLSESQLREAGIDSQNSLVRELLSLTAELLGFPRHLSQHVGGMVIARSPLCDIVPIENAAMEDRTVIEWDKDDLDVLGLFKVDILALGMLTCISKALKLINHHASKNLLELHAIPLDDKPTYDMASDADTIGVFQIESRAQMSMLPRLRPEKFYDFVIEVAIVRPGPIQGNMVHPYLQRREKLRSDPSYEVPYPSNELRDVLKDTLGVPLFQEQAMRLARVAAGFTLVEIDALRRSMAAWKRSGGLEKFHRKFVEGMKDKDYSEQFAEQCFSQIRGFGEYGFPESHAASFAILVNASAWIKRHHPAVFAAALLNSQPMGFYKPAQLVRDAREHGVEVRPVDVNACDWDCTLEHDIETAKPQSADKEFWGIGGPALRLGLRQIKGMREDDANRIATIRKEHGRFDSVEEFHRLTGLRAATVQLLAEADALSSLQLQRRPGVWEAMALSDIKVPLIKKTASQAQAKSAQALLPIMPLSQEVRTDYTTIGLSLKRHPVSFARDQLTRQNILPASIIHNADSSPHGRWVKVAGLVLVRQRPGTASGIVFVTLEDETGTVNLILWSAIYERYRPAARHATLLQADGYVQRQGQVIHILAKRLFDRSNLLQGLSQPSRDFH